MQAADYEVMPCNRQIVELFMALQTQWKRSHTGSLAGIDYQAARAAVELMQVPAADWPELFEGLQVMEFAAVEAAGQA